jgi:hypothetical protein
MICEATGSPQILNLNDLNWRRWLNSLLRGAYSGGLYLLKDHAPLAPTIVIATVCFLVCGLFITYDKFCSASCSRPERLNSLVEGGLLESELRSSRRVGLLLLRILRQSGGYSKGRGAEHYEVGGQSSRKGHVNIDGLLVQEGLLRFDWGLG